MKKLILNIVKYTIGLPMLVILFIFQLFKVLKSIVTNDAFLACKYSDLIRMWKPYTFQNTR